MELAEAFSEEYTTLFERGNGIHGRVALCQHNTDGCLKSVKIVPRDMSRIVVHPNLLPIYEIYEDDTNIKLIEELCTSNLEEIINNNKLNATIPCDKEIMKLWLNLLDGLYALVESCQCHGNITVRNILYKNGIYMLSDPLYYYEENSSSNGDSINYSDDIYVIAKMVKEYISPCCSLRIEELAIDENIIQLLNDCLDKKITSFEPLFTNLLFVKYQKEELKYASRFFNHSIELNLPSCNNHDDIIEYMKELVKLDYNDENYIILSDNKSLLKEIKTIISYSQVIDEVKLGLNIFVALIKNKNALCKFQDTFPNYLEWRYMTKTNWIVFDKFRKPYCSKLVITDNINIRDDLQFLEFLIICSYFNKFEILEIQNIQLTANQYSDIISIFPNLRSLILNNLQLDYNKMSELKSVLSKQSNLVNFQLTNNKTIESLLPIIGSTFIHTHLYSLNLSNNTFTVNSTKYLVDHTLFLSHIKYIDLSNCGLHDESVINFFEHFVEYHDLETLILSKVFSKNCVELKWLKLLKLDYNRMHDKGFISLVKALLKLPHIQSLYAKTGYQFYLKKIIELIKIIKLEDEIIDKRPDWVGEYMKIDEKELNDNPKELVQLHESLCNEYDCYEFCCLGGCEMLINCMNQIDITKLRDFIPLLIKINDLSPLSMKFLCCYGLIPALFRLYTSSDKLNQCYALSFLSNCAFCDENVKEIVKYDGICICLTVIQHSEDERLKIHACVLLSNLCEHFDEYKAIISDAQGIESLISCVTEENIVLSHCAITALWNLSSYKDNYKKIKDSNILALFPQLLEIAKDKLEYYGLIWSLKLSGFDNKAGIDYCLKMMGSEMWCDRSNSYHALYNCFDNKFELTDYLKDDDVDIMIKSIKSEYTEEVEYSLRLLRILLPIERLKIHSKLNIDGLVSLSDELQRSSKYECNLFIDSIKVKKC